MFIGAVDPVEQSRRCTVRRVSRLWSTPWVTSGGRLGPVHGPRAHTPAGVVTHSASTCGDRFINRLSTQNPQPCALPGSGFLSTALSPPVGSSMHVRGMAVVFAKLLRRNTPQLWIWLWTTVLNMVPREELDDRRSAVTCVAVHRQQPRSDVGAVASTC